LTFALQEEIRKKKFQSQTILAKLHPMEFAEVHSHNQIEHARNIKDILGSLKTLCKKEISEFSDPKAKALLETSSEVLGSLEKAFHDYITKDNDLWKQEEEFSPQKSSDPWD
jgi:hypothetical protein